MTEFVALSAIKILDKTVEDLEFELKKKKEELSIATDALVRLKRQSVVARKALEEMAKVK